jgi:Flp pilus assembly secretin CpaC
MRRLIIALIVLLAAAATYAAKGEEAAATAGTKGIAVPKQYSARMVMTELHEGKPRTMAEPVLLARDGEAASFLAGGELPVDLGKIQYVRFGTQATISIHELAPDQLRVCAWFSVSTLDTSNPGSIVIPESGIRLIKTIKPGESIEADLPGGDGRHVKVTIKPQ